MNNRKITKRTEDYSRWYLDLIEAAELADSSSVRGCMVFRPNGYALWENIQKVLGSAFKVLGIQNAYFPLFIPKNLIEKEAKHVEGFAKECAVVTHHRLEANEEGVLVPTGLLEEPLVVRPTSETIIYSSFQRWIHSYRDLPLLINQWANVVRWEMRPRPFLRTTEFLWQEGHTAHSTEEEAGEMTMRMIEVYRRFVEDHLAIPVVIGKKSEQEKFAGALYTTCLEALMQDGKALQAATSHMLGQNFAKAFDVKFSDQGGEEQFVWQTSWGLSTRIIGALIMVHGDDKGVIIPPKIAALHAVIIPVAVEVGGKEIVQRAYTVAAKLQEQLGITVKIDEGEGRVGAKFFEWEKKGVPIRIEIGPKELAANSLIVVRRDTGEKVLVDDVGVVAHVENTLAAIQKNLFEKALQRQNEHSKKVNSWDEFKEKAVGSGGFLYSHWCGDVACESQIKKETLATIRCIPLNSEDEQGKCVRCGGDSPRRVIFAKAY
ncbi:MAG: proline--tRNA ligase [Candidatus Brennerbacteria bacterium]|nr:proline--tRNA ligase [Candidatus Brennerbacteria bacterium]